MSNDPKIPADIKAPDSPQAVVPTYEGAFNDVDGPLAATGCVWAGKAYSEGGVHTEGGVSYTCTNGSWVKG